MALRLTNAFVDGSRRALTRTGGVLFVLLLAHQTLLLASLNTVIAAEAPPAASDVIGLTLPISGAAAAALLAVTVVSNAVYFVVLARAFARPIPELSAFPADLYTRRIGRASLSMFVAGVVVFPAVTIGFAFLILPGLFLAACFLFVIFAVGVEDRGVVGALRRSWGLARGNRLRLVAFVLLAGVGGAVVGVVPGLLQMAGAAALGDVGTVLLNSLLYVFLYGIIAEAYLQLAEEDGGLGGSGRAATASSGSAPKI